MIYQIMLLSNSARLFSYRNLVDLIGIKTPETAAKYLNYLEEAFLFFQLNSFSFKYKEQIKSNKKIYTIDNGFMTAKAFAFSDNLRIKSENLVAIELKRQEFMGGIELFYYKSGQGYETDFVIKKGNRIRELIQVSYDLDNPKTKEREIRALLHAKKDLDCDKLTIINNEKEGVESIEWFGIKGEIHFVPFWRWLLSLS